MSAKELQLVDGEYHTRARKPLLPARMFPSLAFYLRLVYLIFSNAVLAKYGKFNGKRWTASSLNVLRGLEGVGVRFTIEGLDHVARLEGPKVFIGNHMSMLETLVLPVMLRPLGPVTFVIKESLLDYPVFKHIMRSRHPIAVTRTNPRQDLKTVLEEGAEKLASGMSIVVFPQTTRTHSFDPEEMSTIGVKLAKRSGAPVIPVALQTSCWQNGKRLKDFGPIDPAKPACFAFGEPLYVAGKGDEEHHQVNVFIEECLKRWRNLGKETDR
jgi:1-acyl-sn-glycerol-3-phosphate acyltransferase